MCLLLFVNSGNFRMQHSSVGLCYLRDKSLVVWCIRKITKSDYKLRGTAVTQWLRCGATNRKVAGSIPDGVIGIFH